MQASTLTTGSLIKLLFHFFNMVTIQENAYILLSARTADAVHRFAEFPRGGLVRMAPIGSTDRSPHDKLVLFIKRKSHYSLIFEFCQWRYPF